MRAMADIIDALDGDKSENNQPVDPTKPLQNPVFVSPLQQELELAKAGQGKQSPVIDKITASDNIGAEPTQRNPQIR